MYRKFLDPTTDLTFKKIFGNQQKTEILIAFLNAVSELSGLSIDAIKNIKP